MGEAKEEADVGKEELWCKRLLDITHMVHNIYALLGVGSIVRKGFDNVGW